MRPKGWGDQYLMNWLYDEVENLKARQQPSNVDVIEVLANRVAELEAEVARLEVTKASKRGPKPKV